MAHKKNIFLNFCFSCMPGAGQMYQGFIKKGVSIMALFFGVIGIANILNVGEICLVLPIIWFYAFFDAINSNSLPDYEFAQLRDEFIIVKDTEDLRMSIHRFRMPIAIGCIAFGGYSLIKVFFDMLSDIVNIPEDVYWEISRWVNSNIPRVAIALLIIWFGMRLIKGKRTDIDNRESYDNGVIYGSMNDYEDNSKEDEE